MKKFHLLLPFLLFIFACSSDIKEEDNSDKHLIAKKKNIEYGFNLDDFQVVRDTIRSGDTFGPILDENHVPQSKIFEAVTKIKDSFDVRRIKIEDRGSTDSLTTTY